MNLIDLKMHINVRYTLIERLLLDFDVMNKKPENSLKYMRSLVFYLKKPGIVIVKFF